MKGKINMTSKKSTPNNVRPNVVYAKTLYATPLNYEAFMEQDDEEGRPDDVEVFMEIEDAHDASTPVDVNDNWIAIYELKEVVRVKHTVSVLDRVVQKG
jgi:hypothetical protein